VCKATCAKLRVLKATRSKLRMQSKLHTKSYTRKAKSYALKAKSYVFLCSSTSVRTGCDAGSELFVHIATYLAPKDSPSPRTSSAGCSPSGWNALNMKQFGLKEEALEAVGAVGVRTRTRLSDRVAAAAAAAAAVVVVVALAPAAVHLTLRPAPALEVPGLALLLFQEEVHQEDLLLVDLEADVFGDVWNQPVHDVAHEHHDVLEGNQCGTIVSRLLSSNFMMKTRGL